MDYRDNRQRWAESHQVVHFYAGQWCTFTPALTMIGSCAKRWSAKRRGETELAIEYCERTIAWMDAHPADFDPDSREPFCKDIERLRGLLDGGR